MNKQAVRLISSVLAIVGIAALFLGAMTFQNQHPYLPIRENTEIRNQAYLQMAIGFIFIGIGIVALVVYGRSST